MSFLQTNLSPLIKNINQGKVVCPRQMAKQSKTILLRILNLNHRDLRGFFLDQLHIC